MGVTLRAMAVAALMVAGGKAHAFLETGTLLTNAASATYLGGNQGTSVTYSATAKILVANPAVFLWKDAQPTYVAVAGGLVQFSICFSNGGANTAFNVQILDRLPNDAIWQGGSGWFGNLAGSPTVLTVYHCHDNTCTPSSGPWGAGYPTVGDETRPDGQDLYVRWTTGAAQGLGIGASGCINFSVQFQ